MDSTGSFMNRMFVLGILTCFCADATTMANDWARFRGDDGAGVAVAQSVPSEVGPDKNRLWKIAVPAGTSSPIIVGEKLLLTSHAESKRTLHCLNALTGDPLWERSINNGHDEIATPPADPSTPTPVSDGKSVYAFFPDTGVFAWTLDGEELWNRPCGVSRTMHGLSSSLVYSDGRIFQTVDQLNESFIVAYNAETGEELWKTERVSGLTGGYSTPVIYEPKDAAPLLLTTGPFEVVAYNPVSGERVWWLVGKTNAPVSSPMLRGDRLFFCEPVGERIPMSMLGGMDANKDGSIDSGEAGNNAAISRLMTRIDDNWGNKDTIVDEKEWNKAFDSFVGKGGLTAISVIGQGDVTETNVLWSFGKAMPYIPCVLADRETVFVVDDGGIVTTVDAISGKPIKKGRLKQGNGQYYSSPVAAGDHVVVIDTEGVVNILRNSPQWESISTGELGEPVFATPAIAHDRLYVRTTQSLFCFGAADVAKVK